ncbi:MAG: Cdc6/Cdc18 family protein [Candidatus Helarchaeota archaeon]
MNQDVDSIFTNLFKNSIFKDESIFFRDYIPEKILCRDEIIAKLSLAFKIFVNGAHPVNIWITGKPGVGKTTISKFFISNLEKIIKKKTQFKIITCYYNCFMFRRINSIIYHLLSEKFNQSCRGFETEHLISSLIEILKRRKQNLILILDEVHILNKDLMRVLEIGETYEENNFISVIFISREEHYRELNKLLLGRINNIFRIPPYTKENLYDIIEQRAKLGLRGGYSPEVIELISQMAEKSGNARLAIEILYQSGKICDMEGLGKITTDAIRKAKSQVYPQLEEDLFESLGTHELLAFLSIIRKIRHEKKNNISIKDSYPQYLIVCEEFKEDPYAISTYRTKIEYLVKLGFLEKIKLKGRNIKSRNGYSFIESPTDELEKKIINLLK